MSQVRQRKTQADKPAPARPVAPKAAKPDNTKRIVFVAVALASGLLAYNAWPSVRDAIWPKPKIQTGPQMQMQLPGLRFGYLAEEDIPRVSPVKLHLEADEAKREAVRDAFKWSWDAYEKCAFGMDELHPLSCGGSNLSEVGSIGYTVIDSLDSLLVMGFKDEYRRAADWCKEHLDFDRDATFNMFETTIRVLGGLEAAHYLSSISDDPEIKADASFYLERAVDLGDRLLGAFESPTGIPWSGINLHTRTGIPDRDNQGFSSLAEATTLQLEFKYLSHLTGDMVYWRKAERATRAIKGQIVNDGIAPIFISPENGGFVLSEIRLGSRGDSYYEYLLKQYLQTNREETVYRDMYDEAMAGIKKHLVGRTKKSGLIFTQELHPARHPQTNQQTWEVMPKQDHLVCFLGGSFLLGVTEGNTRDLDWHALDPRDMEDLVVGRGIVESCVETYNTPSGLGPEIAMFVRQHEDRADEIDWYIKPGENLIDARNILRPETVESLLLAYRTTGDERYREWGWRIFEAFRKHCRVESGGYAIIKDVRVNPPLQEDRMETFWLSETLKYLYLLFDDSDHIRLDKHVFNTEAHILPVFKPAALTAFSTS
ncbi:hypothetical protein CspHIS471_0211610 [Cutaneotrichosporon sp. HIS471]|nr:hypothetical protein CspHIS471_0211610 [Cutaneotrichosporon sp. HIS471]